MVEYLSQRDWVLRSEGASEPPLEGDALACSEDAHDLEFRVKQLVSETGLSPLTVRVCLTRGMRSSQEILDFLNPSLTKLTSPDRFKDMDRAVSRLVQARESKELLWIFGDYDVDGTAGAALLSWVFEEFGYEFQARQPDRFKDGYGLNVEAVEEAHAAGAGVLITVDCGISSFEAAERAKELGLDMIVLDHHQLDPDRGIPSAFAVVNPQRPDCESGLKQLCGCGVAFYLSMALRTKGRELGWFPPGKEPNLKKHLDLVVMATAADQVPLTGDNRILVRHGMQVLKESQKPGVKALMDVAGLAQKTLSPGHLGFVLGPRINASGRLKSASLALNLLRAKEIQEGYHLAQELEKLNQERSELQNQIWDQVREKVEKEIADGSFDHGIVVADEGWHEGVVGIVASRVTELFRRPAIVISIRDGVGKGSARTYGGKNVLEAIRASSEPLLGFGGHKHAAGLSLPADRIDEFAKNFDAAVKEVTGERKKMPLMIEGGCTLDDFDLHTLEEMEALGPFGPGNPEPVFSIQASVSSQRILKERHLKLGLFSAEAEKVQNLEAIWFNAVERADVMESLNEGLPIEWAGVPELNRFRGRVTPTFRVYDRRLLAPTKTQIDS
jgi:single-stranded-DNA-specific exonuclease